MRLTYIKSYILQSESFQIFIEINIYLILLLHKYELNRYME